MCGAAAEPAASQCAFCRARLATVSCAGCFGLVFVGSRHCAHCGVAVAAPAPRPTPSHGCPRCRVAMQPISLGKVPLDACPSCAGTWLDVHAFEQLCADAEQQAAVLACTAPAAATTMEKVRYSPCPACGKVMNRVNFAKSSGIVVDVCRADGVWLDADELRRVVEFVRAGGLEAARLREKRALEEDLRLLRLKQVLGRQDTHYHATKDRDEPAADGLLVQIFSHFAS